MKHSMSSSLDRAALVLGILLFLGVMIEDYRNLLGQLMDFFLGWLPDTGLSFPVILFVLAAITGLYASLVQKYTMDWDFMRRQQEKMRALQTNMRAAQLAGETRPKFSLCVEQMKMVSEQGKMMQMQFKPMLYIGIISIPLFMWIYFYIKSSGGIIMTFPFWGTHSITDMVLGPILYWFYWYFVCSLPVSQIIRKALDIGSMS